MQRFFNAITPSIPWCSSTPTMATKLPQASMLFQAPNRLNELSMFPPPSSSSRWAQRAISSETRSTIEVMKSKEKDELSLIGLRQDCLPKHLAVILDGNRRWFKNRGLELDYEPFLKSNLLVADLCIKYGIGTTTCFIYALENMRRSQETNDLIFRQFEKFLMENIDHFTRENMKVTIIGERSMYPNSLITMIDRVEEATSKFSKLELMFALCYGGTLDVVQATKSICKKVKAGEVQLEDITETLVEQELYTKRSRAPQVDILVRTGGHLRLSNFLLWQCSQAEFYFTGPETMAPNFGEHVFVDALRSYQDRERTFGK